MAYKILLVDDSSLVRKVIMKSLGMSELQVDAVHEAENGQQALQLLAENPVDVIFLDINMPVMNGIEFMRRVSSTKHLKTIPVIVVSTEGSNERKSELDELGIRAYLRKPVTPEQLTETIRGVLGA